MQSNYINQNLTKIENELYSKYDVKKGLRNEDGTGVLVGLTKIADVVGYDIIDQKKIDIDGKLYYRGVNVQELVLQDDKRFLFEETCFLILFGYLPTIQQLEEFKLDLSHRYSLPKDYIEGRILGFPSHNLMNKLQQEILALYNYDDRPDEIGIDETLEKGLDLIAKIPSIICYAYHSKNHYYNDGSLIIHQINDQLSIAENILYLLRDNKQFSPKEAELLEIALVLHADHGGGNNSTFTNVVISSTGTDIYSSFAGSIGSLKGPRHGGANLAVMKQMRLVLDTIGEDATDQQIEALIDQILAGQFNDQSGLIYGIGHAVYTKSDPRCQTLSKKCHELAIEKNQEKKYLLFNRFEKIAIKKIFDTKAKVTCANVDFYSGFIYEMLGIPEELFTLLFVVGRSVGWLAHNIENKKYSGKIIRPAAKYVGEKTEFIARNKR